MSYTLQAFVTDDIPVGTAIPSNAVVVRLPQGKTMLVLSEQLREAHGIPFLPLTDEGATELPSSIAVIAEAIAKARKVAYVEAEFFGGDGTQACVTWDATLAPSRPLVDPGAINAALRFLGVKVGDHHDEFDALGLGRYRDTEDWLRIAEPDAAPINGSAAYLGDSGAGKGPPSTN